ncbi:ABC transporter permease subunit [Paenibacillus sacheonensis]|uniref:ABC transporter permease subunit n=1 Tax=Paenibacillus sacheonensis TaxID=742054 RepID=A0A7X5BZL6_9BACL|nr:ABC transporter permease subunit [Paenibacillus sacheonensis]MBM7563108.1 peptide/nickel transport system permease protein [Paenibacillus sacheonensis]NBC68325.1 ABC transporter permease subunit [Paenibacillus sacheonensis]
MNKTLLAGLILTFLIIAASLLGRFAAPHDLSEHLGVDYSVDENGEGTLTVPPSPPTADYPFGTDKYGYDLMAKMLAGSKYTIIGAIAVAFGRLFIGGIIGLLLGYYGSDKPSRMGRLPIWNVLSGFPVFVIVWMIMIGITMNPAASPLLMTVILVVVLTLVGLPSVASVIKEKTMIIREKQFVLSAKSIGAGQWTIVRTHVFPHLKESFAVMFVQEIVLTLALFGQMAIFNIFVGGTKMFFDPAEYNSRTNEWSGLIGQARDQLFYYQWLLFIPLAAYILFILGFHLISVGLEKQYRQRFSKVSHL